MEEARNINSLPQESLVEIFKYLKQNELARVSRVCRRWYQCAKSPVLWNKIDVKFSWFGGSQNEIVLIFSKNIPSSATYMKLDFTSEEWGGGLNFEQLCMLMKRRCPRLHTLILNRAHLSISLSSVINLCMESLPHLKALIARSTDFGDICKEGEYGGHSNIEILNISICTNVEDSMCSNVGHNFTIHTAYTISRMPQLQKLSLAGLLVSKSFFNHVNAASFLQRLKCLHLGYTSLSCGALRAIEKYAVNLTELFLCGVLLFNYDFEFKHSAFPLLETICLGSNKDVVCKNIVSIVQSFKSLQNLYVEESIIALCAEQPFFIENVCKLRIVKPVNCNDHEREEFLLG